MNWQILDDLVNPRRQVVHNKLVAFFQCLMRPMDAFTVRLWNAWFLHHSPMKKRKFFIDMLGNQLQSLPDNVQEDYFRAVDFDCKVYLLQHNMLSTSTLDLLYNKKFDLKDGVKAFIYAGKISDAGFQHLTLESIKIYSEKFDLSLNKQCHLIREAP